MVPVPMVLAGLGPAEVLIILLVVVLLFGAKKLPELARGSGQALRIFETETRGLLDDDGYADRVKTPSEEDTALHPLDRRQGSRGERT